MLESISCPSCSTHYGLRPERVRPGLRRAKCYRCAEFFDIENAVAHLLTLQPAAAPVVVEPEPEVVPAPVEALAAPPVEAVEPAPEPMSEAPDLGVFDELDLSILSAVPPPPAPAPLVEDSALSLSDLEGVEDEIMDKTLLIDPTSVLAAPPVVEEPHSGTGFSSAKDAIAKLLGDAPMPPPTERRTQTRGGMDVEATLDALEQTLGGTVIAPPPAPEPTPEPTPAPVPEASMGSTVRLSTAELQAAMAAAAPKPVHQMPTMGVPLAPPPPPAPIMPVAAPESNLLKIQLGQEMQENVSLDQMVAWIEQGRVQDYHLVARQHSENWIEAGKVPSLRPAFDRVRRMSASASREPLPAPPEAMPVKRGGLFGWMSGRG